MAYIGRQLVRGQNRVLDDISSSFNGSTTAFNLTVSSSSSPPASVNQLWIILGGILQRPGTDFTVADAVITFTTAPAAVLSFWGLIQGDTSDINSPADASVTPSKIASSGDFAFPADVRFNDADGSHYVGLQAPSTVSSNLVWTLPAADGSANQVLKTDGSGALGWASDANAPEGTAVLSTGETGTTKYLRVDGDNTCSWQLAVDATKMPLAGGTFTDDVTFTGDSSNGLWDKSANAFVADLTGTASIATSITVADESTDTSCNVLFATAATGNLGAKSGTNLTFNSNTGALTATSFVGALTGTASGNAVLTGSTDNTICTVTGANAIAGEASLTFDAGLLKIDDLSGTAGKGRLEFGNSGEQYIEGFDTGNGGGGSYLSFGDGGAEYLRIKSGGSVGIGISSPDCKLHVYSGDSGGSTASGSTLSIENSTTTTLQFLSPNNAYNAIRFGDNNDNGAGWIQYNHSDNSMQFGNNGSEEMRILSGGGITFNGDTAAANALDDYEEGTWSPTMGGGGGPSGYNVQYGRYTKIGNTCIAHFHLDCDGGPSSDNNISVDSLPFTATSSDSGNACSFSYIDGFHNTWFTGMVNANNAYIRLYQIDGSYLTWNEVSNKNNGFRGTVIYHV